MCVAKPRVALISTGDEIVAPNAAMQPGLVFDSNAQVLADAIRELGGDPDAFRHRPRRFGSTSEAK